MPKFSKDGNEILLTYGINKEHYLLTNQTLGREELGLIWGAVHYREELLHFRNCQSVAILPPIYNIVIGRIATVHFNRLQIGL